MFEERCEANAALFSSDQFAAIRPYLLLHQNLRRPGRASKVRVRFETARTKKGPGNLPGPLFVLISSL